MNDSWIVKRKHSIAVGDTVAVLRSPSSNGIINMTLSDLVGEVVDITSNHVELLLEDGERFYAYAQSVFATPPVSSE